VTVSPAVLLVDDDDDFRAFAKRLIASWGHGVEEAATCSEALHRAAELNPDTVLADIGLPDGDGIELARRLTGMPRPPRVILISADPDAGRGGAARRAGAIAFFAKADLMDPALRALLAAR
jgi:CheY-like chemotaxis protein